MNLFPTSSNVSGDVCTTLFAAVSALTGVLTSVLAGTPVGATIIAVDMFVFAVCWIIGKRG